MWIERNEDTMKVEVNSQLLPMPVTVLMSSTHVPQTDYSRASVWKPLTAPPAFRLQLRHFRRHIEAGVDGLTAFWCWANCLPTSPSLCARENLSFHRGSTDDHHVGQVDLHHAAHAGKRISGSARGAERTGRVDSPTFAQAVLQASVAILREENLSRCSPAPRQFGRQGHHELHRPAFPSGPFQLHLDAPEMRPISTTARWSVARCCATRHVRWTSIRTSPSISMRTTRPAGLRERRARVHLPAHRRQNSSR